MHDLTCLPVLKATARSLQNLLEHQLIRLRGAPSQAANQA